MKHYIIKNKKIEKNKRMRGVKKHKTNCWQKEKNGNKKTVYQHF